MSKLEGGESYMDVFELEINKEEVLRYLGYKGQEIDENLSNTIEECREEIKKIIIPRVIYSYKNIIWFFHNYGTVFTCSYGDIF